MKQDDISDSGQAVALRYDGRGAPRVSAKGDGELARRILAVAEANDIPIYRDQALSRLLSQVELDMEIPLALYVAVAEVISFAYHLKDKVPPPVRKRRPGSTYEHGTHD